MIKIWPLIQHRFKKTEQYHRAQSDPVYARIVLGPKNNTLKKGYIMSITVGIDISKEKFDVCIEKENGDLVQRTFKNEPSGFKKLSFLLKNKQVIACLEATGVYGENLCQFLHDMGVTVYLMNPSQIKYYAKSIMKRAKTDKVDSGIIMQYIKLHANKLKPWQPRSKEYNQLKSLHRCLTTFKEERIRIQGCMEACTSTDRDGQSVVHKVYKAHLKSIDNQIGKLEEKLLTIIEKSEELKNHYKNLQTIPGIASRTAIGLLSELPDLQNFTHVKELVAYAGLNPSIRQSGSSVQGSGRISKMGSKTLRNILYMPALSGKNSSKAYRPFTERLKEKGKKPKVIVVAVMHKILRIVFAVLKKGVPFDETALI